MEKTKKKEKKRFDPAFLVMVGPVSGWMLLFVLIPFIYIVVISFMKRSTYGGVEMEFTIQNILQVFDPAYLKVFGVSILYALITTALCILIGYPFAYFVAIKSEIQKTVIMALVMVPFMISSLIRLFAWINLLRRDGAINHFLMAIGLVHEP